MAGLIRVGEDVVISLEARVDDECAAELNGSNRHNKPQTPQRCALLQLSAASPCESPRIVRNRVHAVPASGQLCLKHPGRFGAGRPKARQSAAVPGCAVAATDLEDAFIVRLENGRDVCMLLRATLAPSACGMHLVDLLRTVVPATYGHTGALVLRGAAIGLGLDGIARLCGRARALPHAKLVADSSFHVPKECWRMVGSRQTALRGPAAGVARARSPAGHSAHQCRTGFVCSAVSDRRQPCVKRLVRDAVQRTDACRSMRCAMRHSAAGARTTSRLCTRLRSPKCTLHRAAPSPRRAVPCSAARVHRCAVRSAETMRWCAS